MKSNLCQYPDPPAQPPESSWPFEKELQKPVHCPIAFSAGKPRRHELDFRRGIRLASDFPDPQGLLQTACQDFQVFLKSIKLNDAGPCPLTVEYARTSIFEEYRIEVRKDRMAILAADTEGIRRGLIELEDRILSRGAYCLPIGIIAKKPVIRTRLARCFYGPINRPPKCRDELNDDVNYYSDGYLNRLAHNGINALWLTLTFKDTCPSRIIPEYGRDSARRLAKLRRTVGQCARYGIKIYPFCIEPAALPVDSPIFRAHPELKGHTVGGCISAFCTSSDTGRAYVEEAARTLFSEVPGLGGLICIPVGERFTHCYSSVLPESGKKVPPNNCPRCFLKKPWEVLADTLAAFERGMRAVAPGAELIAWPYSQTYCWGSRLQVEAAGHMPKNVILQHNYESGGRVKQLGKWRTLWDYWLSWVGPSKIFADCARAARKNKTRVFAKLQTSCSHEVATTRYLPVPGLIYRKYKEMHKLGVSGAMLGWYFGNYPSLMTKASEMLAFAPFPKTERDFLMALARRDWGRHAPEMVKAWQYFTKGYVQYPGAHIFGYYGPMHDGVVWPLYLEPRHLPLSATWQIAWPPSGDQVGECVSHSFNYVEILTLCRGMRDNWRQGMKIMRRLEACFRNDKECRQDIGVAAALGLQFDSGYNILSFYYLRDKLANASGVRRKLELLGKIRGLVKDEIRNDEALLQLCRNDRRIGFHSEAEGYKYYPEKITWRIGQLKALLRAEFRDVEKKIRAGDVVFPDYVGRGPSVQAYKCHRIKSRAELSTDPFSPGWNGLAKADCAYWLASPEPFAGRPIPDGNALNPVDPAKVPPSRLAWRAAYDRQSIYICAESSAVPDKGIPAESGGDYVSIEFEPNRLGAYTSFIVFKNGDVNSSADEGITSTPPGWKAKVACRGNVFRVVLAVPFTYLGLAAPRGTNDLPGFAGKSCGFPRGAARIRVNVTRYYNEKMLNSWAKGCPVRPRLCFGYTHPAIYGWLDFEK